MFGAIKLTKYTGYSRYSIGFDSRSEFSLSNFDWGKNRKNFVVEIVLQFILIIRKSYMLAFGKGPAQGLYNTKITAEARYSINCFA